MQVGALIISIATMSIYGYRSVKVSPINSFLRKCHYNHKKFTCFANLRKDAKFVKKLPREKGEI